MMNKKITLSNLLNEGLCIQNIWGNKKTPIDSSYKLKGLKKIKCRYSHDICYLPKNINSYQLLAIYINELYGDGFYYISYNEEESETYYLLIINNGNVSSETDCLINKEMLEHFIVHKDYSEYKKLEIKELDSYQLAHILDEYMKVKEYTLRRNKRLFFSLLILFLIAAFGVIFLIDSIVNI
ncbi:TPA: hypothetical protein ACKRZV_000988 [Proteus mirabilis]